MLWRAQNPVTSYRVHLHYSAVNLTLPPAVGCFRTVWLLRMWPWASPWRSGICWILPRSNSTQMWCRKPSKTSLLSVRMRLFPQLTVENKSASFTSAVQCFRMWRVMWWIRQAWVCNIMDLQNIIRRRHNDFSCLCVLGQTEEGQRIEDDEHYRRTLR